LTEIFPVKVRRAHKDKRKNKCGTGGLAITIPYKIREELGIKKGDILLVTVKEIQLSIYKPN
jgi:AbrB family looped-hinge helix DNA binding protein